MTRKYRKYKGKLDLSDILAQFNVDADHEKWKRKKAAGYDVIPLTSKKMRRLLFVILRSP